MDNKGYLNEEKYQKNKKKIIICAIIVLILGLSIGGGIITAGIIKQSKINSEYSEEKKASISEQIETEKQNLIRLRTQLEEKIKPTQDEIKQLERVNFTGFDDAYYARKDKIEELKKSIVEDQKSINIINNVLDGKFDYCNFDDAKNNAYTSNYCSLKNQIDDINWDSNKSHKEYDCIPFYMIGGFIVIATCMISGSIYSFAKRREIMAFKVQQMMPVAQEGIEEMTPTVGNAAGEIAKSVTRGMKEGLSSNDQDKSDK